MLFTDGPFVTSKDLNIIDREFIQLAADNNIPVDGSPDSLVSRATLAAGAEFTAQFQNFSGYLVGVGVSSNHLAAVLNVLSTAINRPRALLQQIPVIEPNPTRSAFIRWVRYYCLHDFYQSLAYQFVNEDKYRLKMELYNRERKAKWSQLNGNGVPVVLNPFSCPGAVWDYGAGIWAQSNVTTPPQGGTTGGTFDMAITWVSAPGYLGPTNQNGGESGPSLTITTAPAAGTSIAISLANLIPPNGTMQPAIGTAQGVFAPQSASGWNIYIGKAGDNIKYLQNVVPIPIATTSYQLPGDPTLSGYTLNPGQPAQFDYTIQKVLWRG